MPSRDKYSDPQLRDQVKEEVQESDKGGAPGQWSARKAQFMASEYKKRGGGYTTDKENGQDESQKNLDKWSSEEWQTKEGSGEAKKSDGSRKRYLPKKAWEQMDDKEKEQTDEKKQQESKEGKQFVGNTGKAKGARKNVSEDSEKKSQANGAKSNGTKSNGAKSNGTKKDSKKDEGKEDDDDDEDDDEDEYQEDKDEEDEEDEDQREDEEEDQDGDEHEEEKENNDEKQAGQKRGRGKKAQEESPSKKQKDNKGQGKQSNGEKQSNGDAKKAGATMGSKHDSADAPAPQGSAKRLPKKGQKVTWKAMPGWVHGQVLEVVTENKTMEGKSIKASKQDPKIALKAESGKFCVHKPDACYFEDA